MRPGLSPLVQCFSYLATKHVCDSIHCSLPTPYAPYTLVCTPDPSCKEGSGDCGMGLGNNLAGKYPAGMPWFLNSANFLFQMINTIGQIQLRFSKFLCSNVYSLPVISLTQMLVG